MTIQLEILGIQGHEARVFDDTKPQDRDVLGRTVEDLLLQGYRCFLRNPDGNPHRIIGYDQEHQAWITFLKPHFFCAGQKVSAVPVLVGG